VRAVTEPAVDLPIGAMHTKLMDILYVDHPEFDDLA
jgi:hypothetical protein